MSIRFRRLVRQCLYLTRAPYHLRAFDGCYISWYAGTTSNWDYLISYVGQWDKGLEFDGRPIDDVSTFNINVGYYITPRYRLSMQIRDIFDRNFEILPDYSAGGREFSIALDLSL